MGKLPFPALSTLRARVVIWSVLVTGVTLFLFGGYVYMELAEIQSATQAPALAHRASEELLIRMLVAAPVALALAGAGGLFLAGRALSPIDDIARTTEAIHATDLSRRVSYRGSLHEVGRLAATIDRMLDRLEAAFARERRFTADASHELRTPLTSMKGRIGVTLSRPRSTAEYESSLRDLEKEADRLIPLTSALLFLARFDHQRLASEVETVDLSELLEAVLEQTHPLAEPKGIDLVASIERGLVVRGVTTLLISLFVNLLDNAMTYTPPHGQVTLDARRRGDAVEVGVTDTGPGIAPEHLPHLFEPFYRVATDRSRVSGGAGLGLAIAHEIARFHGTTIVVRSTPGEGSTFSVRIERQPR